MKQLELQPKLAPPQPTAAGAATPGWERRGPGGLATPAATTSEPAPAPGAPANPRLAQLLWQQVLNAPLLAASAEADAALAAIGAAGLGGAALSGAIALGAAAASGRGSLISEGGMAREPIASGAAGGGARTSDSRAQSRASELSATAYLLAGHIQQLTTPSAAQAPAGAPVPAAVSVQTAVSVVVEAANERGGLATVSLDHAQLGPIELSIELAEGAVRVSATATTQRAAEVIAEGQAALAARLSRQGVALELLEVHVLRKRKQDKKSGNRARGRARR